MPHWMLASEKMAGQKEVFLTVRVKAFLTAARLLLRNCVEKYKTGNVSIHPGASQLELIRNVFEVSWIPTVSLSCEVIRDRNHKVPSARAHTVSYSSFPSRPRTRLTPNTHPTQQTRD